MAQNIAADILPCHMPYTSRHDPENNFTGLEIPIPIETPWLRVTKIKLKSHSPRSRYYKADFKLTLLVDDQEYPEYAARMAEIDRPPLDTPRDSIDKYTQTMVGQLQFKIRAWMGTLSSTDLEHVGWWRQSIELWDTKIKVGDRIKCHFDVLGYTRKCARIRCSEVNKWYVRQINEAGEVEKETYVFCAAL